MYFCHPFSANLHLDEEFSAIISSCLESNFFNPNEEEKVSRLAANYLRMFASHKNLPKITQKQKEARREIEIIRKHAFKQSFPAVPVFNTASGRAGFYS